MTRFTFPMSPRYTVPAVSSHVALVNAHLTADANAEQLLALPVPHKLDCNVALYRESASEWTPAEADEMNRLLAMSMIERLKQ